MRSTIRYVGLQIRSFANGPRRKRARKVPEQEDQWLREGVSERSHPPADLEDRGAREQSQDAKRFR